MSPKADLPELTLILRNANNPTSARAVAVESMAELGELDAVDTLLRAATEDPDGEVRSAAVKALQYLLGRQAEEALRVHRSSAAPDDPWLAEMDARETVWEKDNLSGLYILLQSDPDPAKRRKAVAALAKFSDLSVGTTLARIALDDDDNSVRQAARMALEEKYPGAAEDILEAVGSDIEADEDLEDEDMLFGDESDEEAEVLGGFTDPTESVLAEVKPPLVPWIAMGVMVILVMLVYFIFIR